MDTKEFIAVSSNAVPSLINKPVHLKWADKGCVWILRGYFYDGVGVGRVTLETPKTHKCMVGYAKDLVYTRAEEQKFKDAGKYLCTFCQKNYVDSDLGFDTCQECLSKQ